MFSATKYKDVYTLTLDQSKNVKSLSTRRKLLHVFPSQ